MIFVSGLYGLLLWDEPIQDYDCHFADYTLGANPKTIKEKWGSVLTDVLIAFINNSGRSGRGGKISACMTCSRIPITSQSSLGSGSRA
jgi:hypothetical protein